MEHWSSQAVLQQTPSTQKPDAHSELAAHPSASGLPGSAAAASGESFAISPPASAVGVFPPAPAAPSGESISVVPLEGHPARRLMRTTRKKERLPNMADPFREVV